MAVQAGVSKRAFYAALDRLAINSAARSRVACGVTEHAQVEKVHYEVSVRRIPSLARTCADCSAWLVTDTNIR